MLRLEGLEGGAFLLVAEVSGEDAFGWEAVCGPRGSSTSAGCRGPHFVPSVLNDVPHLRPELLDVPGGQTGSLHRLQDPHLGYALAFGMIVLTGAANGLYIWLRARAERWVK